jgi:hypothetical protein
LYVRVTLPLTAPLQVVSVSRLPSYEYPRVTPSGDVTVAALPVVGEYVYVLVPLGIATDESLPAVS